MSKKKILILTDWYEPGFKAGGPIQSCRNFVAAMHNEFEIFVLTSDRDLGEKQGYPDIPSNRWVKRSPGIQVYYAQAALLNSKKLAGIIRELGPDFIYLNSMYSWRFSILPMLLSWQKKIAVRIVLAPRGMLQEGAMQFKTTKKKFFIGLLNQMNLPQKIRFQATDEQEMKDIRLFFPRAESIQEVSNFSAPLPAELRGIQKIPGVLRIVYISRVIPKKNLVFFLGILQKLPADIQLHFDIYGEVEDEAYWEQGKQIIQSMPSNITVQEHGALAHEKVTETLEANHLFVLPSLGENFGHAIFESWSASRPALISDKTPWHGLKSRLTGWDLPLDKPRIWEQAIEEAAHWDQPAFDSWCRNSREFALHHVEQFNLKQDYLKLFN